VPKHTPLTLPLNHWVWWLLRRCPSLGGGRSNERWKRRSWRPETNPVAQAMRSEVAQERHCQSESYESGVVRTILQWSERRTVPDDDELDLAVRVRRLELRVRLSV
jgi:hypothetical protein